MKNWVLILASLCSVTSIRADETYEIEILYRVGDFINGAEIYDLDSDDPPPVINNFGEIGFLAVTELNEGMHFRSVDGQVTRLFGYEDRLRPNEYGESHLWLGMDEDEFAFGISDTGHIYHSDDDDRDYVGVDDRLLFSSNLGNINTEIEIGGNFVWQSAVFDRFDGVYLRGNIVQSPATLDYRWGTLRDKKLVLNESVTVVSPSGLLGYLSAWEGNPGIASEAVFDGRTIAKAGSPELGDTIAFLDANDSGHVLTTEGRIFEYAHVYLDGIKQPSCYFPGKAKLTADGSVLFKGALCLDGEFNGIGGLMLDDYRILGTGDIIAGESELTGFSYWSANERGDVVFIGRFTDGIKRMVLARRIIEPQFGDVNNDNAFDLGDANNLILAARDNRYRESFDLVKDGVIDFSDIEVWVHDVKNTYFGDANLDGEFNSQDLVRIFTAGEYEDDIAGNSLWLDGDWNGDGEFNSSDLVLAFQDGGYELGPKPQQTQFVPEPKLGGLLWIIPALVWLVRKS